MNASITNRALPIQPPPDPADVEMAPLLCEPFAQVWATPAAATDAARVHEAVRGRLAERLRASQAAASAMHTCRRRRAAGEALAPGVVARTLYSADAAALRRPGEPTRARLIELAPGAIWAGDMADQGAATPHREWLVLEGSLVLGDETLGMRDYHVAPAGFASPSCTSPTGALLFLRESAMPKAAGDRPFTVHDAQAGWAEFSPGIQRRVLWQRDGQAALLYYAQAGALVPAHRHGHDEECLMVQGELFLDDLLLQPGDYQLAPAGTGHRITHTDTGVVIYAHGDLDLRFVA